MFNHNNFNYQAHRKFVNNATSQIKKFKIIIELLVEINRYLQFLIKINVKMKEKCLKSAYHNPRSDCKILTKIWIYLPIGWLIGIINVNFNKLQMIL